MAESSSVAPPPKPVVVRVKRKPSQSPVDAFWLEINERPLKRPLLDFGNLSISDSDSAKKVEFCKKKVFMQHVETVCSSEVAFDVMQSFMDPGSSGSSESKLKIEHRKKQFFKMDDKQEQLLLKAKQEKESSAKDARFEQIWKRRKGGKTAEQEKALQEICQFYDIVRVDSEENSKEVQQEEMSLEDQRLLSSYLPLLREFIPNAAEEIEADMVAQAKQEGYVYDFYTVMEETDVNNVDDSSSYSYPLVQVNDDEDYYDGPDYSDYETDDSNAEGNPLNDYPEEISEDEDEEAEDSERESEECEHEDHSDEEEDLEHDGISKDHDADPLFDDEFDDYGGDDTYDAEDWDNEDWKWSHR
ncbi:hypothetical protein PIB30_005172 [Stylosanthes scabra]|uniref:RNA-directed DNA methylation 4 n=1 Tax=Stylosanthes scabra TaxID=79078 RepID=A0ABU6R3W5_9FABA|nr:hypothetical protein [Stylosanthes scabra]